MKILFIANTPFELYYLSSVACLLKVQDKNLKASLLIRQEINNILTPEIRGIYSNIEVKSFPTLTPAFSKNPVKIVYNLFENFRQTFQFRSYLKKHNFDYDVICISSSREFFANMMWRHVPRKIRLVAFRMATQKVESEMKFRKRPVLSFIFNLKNFIFCYSRMEYKFRLDWNNVAEKNFINYPYQCTILITDWDIGPNHDKTIYRLPPPFIALKSIYKIKDSIPSILIAGEPTPIHPSWSAENQNKYEEFLSYLRDNFKEYKLYFKPRMVFKNAGNEILTDVNAYNLKGFEIIPAENSFEEVCLTRNIKKVISIISTASKVGVYFGISSYLLYPLFRESEFGSSHSKVYFDSYFDDMNSIVRVNKFEDIMTTPKLFMEEYNFDALSSLYWEAIIK